MRKERWQSEERARVVVTSLHLTVSLILQSDILALRIGEGPFKQVPPDDPSHLDVVISC